MTKRVPYPGPNYPIAKVMNTDTPDILDPDRTDDTIGNLTDNPPAPSVNRDVHVNWTWARQPEGAHCIHITGPTTFTYTEIEALLPVLAEVVEPVRTMRTIKGFHD